MKMFKSSEKQNAITLVQLAIVASDKFLSGDHSEVVPLLPIPNRTVKHLSADDSADCPCESRSLPDSPK
jgi:hypothetical protein